MAACFSELNYQFWFNVKDGNESPESGSLYSDEIPSGYNSGEQYDTVSCGYMSGEAYELPETRMELREPALEVIDECIQPLGTFANSDQDIFRMPFITMGKIFKGQSDRQPPKGQLISE